MITAQKALAFQALHQAESAFIIPNPWDKGSTRLLQSLGFAALASTSAGFAFSQGQADQTMSRDAVLQHLHELCSATELPVSADLENGFGPRPEDVAETILLAARAGVVGASIEDARADAASPQYTVAEASDRIRAAVAAARTLPYPFMLTARAENFLFPDPDLGDTIRRLQAYQEAGADVLFAPGIRQAQDIATLVKELDKPVNVMMGMAGVSLSLDDLNALGVKRVSLGGSLARTALGALLHAATELRDHGTFNFAKHAPSGAQIQRLLQG